ncbi:MAG: tetratricopeptide repeat protein [Lachnospiraceae bacterium]|nr:tetratricopeptide repeat protein [Lachnospiraceae bacterium]
MFKIAKIIILCVLIILCSACTNKKINQYKIYGLDYLANEDYEEALNYFDMAISEGKGRIGKTQYELLLYKAECLFMLNRYSDARDIYEILLKIDKNNTTYKELYNNLNSIAGLIEFKNAINANDLEAADKILNELKNSGFEQEKSVIFNQAVLYEKRGEWKNALNTFNYFLKQYPGDEAALHEVEFISAQLNNVSN